VHCGHCRTLFGGVVNDTCAGIDQNPKKQESFGDADCALGVQQLKLLGVIA
jgi:hypothetical protein